ncbi:hypothetical protein ACUOCP_35825, partial [Escherichia sp. R-CC3]
FVNPLREGEGFIEELIPTVKENTDCVVTVTDLADQQAFAEALASADILTNGTKVGMKPLENESLVNDISLLHPGLLVTECVYNPHMTKLLQQAQQAGCKTIDGYGMLLWQGAEQFTLWTGKDFPLEYVKQLRFSFFTLSARGQ